jgi:hypothetical protein
MTTTIETRAMTVLEYTRALSFKTKEDADSAAVYLTTVVKPFRKATEDELRPQVDHWHEGHKAALALLKKHTAPYIEAEKLIKEGLKPWTETAKLENVSTRDKYRVEIVDLMELVKAVAKGKLPLTMLLPNQKELDNLAQSYKNAMQIPGCKIVCDQVLSARSA